MMISFIVILSFVSKTTFSLSLQGSLSMHNDNVISIDLYTNKSNDGVDELIGKLYAARRILLTVDLGEKIINIQQASMEINDGFNRYRDYLAVNFNKMTTSINIVEPEMASRTINGTPFGKFNSTNAKVGGTVLRELFCKTLHNVDFLGNIISRTCNINLISIDEEGKSTDKYRNKTRLRYDTTTGDETMSREKTRILSHSTLITSIGSDNFKEKSSITTKIISVYREFKMNESAVIENNLTNANPLSQISEDKTVSMNQKKISRKDNIEKRMFKDNLLVSKTSDPENRFSTSKDVSDFSPDDSTVRFSITTDKRKPNSTNVISQIPLQENVTNVPTIFSRRTFQIHVPWSKDKNVQNQSHVSRKNIGVGRQSDATTAGTRTKMHKTSAMDEILEAVHRVLPTEELAKMPPKGSKIISEAS